MSLGDGLIVSAIATAALRGYVRHRVAMEWAHAKARLGAEVEQLKQRHNYATLAAQQAEERARGRG